MRNRCADCGAPGCGEVRIETRGAVHGDPATNDNRARRGIVAIIVCVSIGEIDAAREVGGGAAIDGDLTGIEVLAGGGSIKQDPGECGSGSWGQARYSGHGRSSR